MYIIQIKTKLGQTLKFDAPSLKIAWKIVWGYNPDGYQITSPGGNMLQHNFS